MPYIPPETVEKLREVDLLTYLQRHEPDNLKCVTSGVYRTRNPKGIEISNGKWNWFREGFGGVSALDYLTKVQGHSFMHAAGILMGIAPAYSSEYLKPQEKKKAFILPEECKGMNKVKAYLKQRGISDKVINYCIQTGRLYESLPYHNAVFVGYDQTNTARYAFQRGCGTDFRGDVAGSDKRFSFTLPAFSSSNAVYVFESAIDLLSYATLLQKTGRDFRQYNLLSVEGVHRPGKVSKMSKLPLALGQYLTVHPDTAAVKLYFDNDETGRMAAAMITELLPNMDVTARFPPPDFKDVNDFLTGKKVDQKLSKPSFSR